MHTCPQRVGRLGCPQARLCARPGAQPWDAVESKVGLGLLPEWGAQSDPRMPRTRKHCVRDEALHAAGRQSQRETRQSGRRGARCAVLQDLNRITVTRQFRF